MIHTTNILAAPLLIIAWGIDAYLFLATARLIFGQLPATRESQLSHALKKIVDPLAQWLNRKASAWFHRPGPPWLPWTIVFVGCLTVRHLLLVIAMSISLP
jgi:hypothetical protein